VIKVEIILASHPPHEAWFSETDSLRKVSMSLIQRMPTGVPGLDDMIEGGLPIPSLTLVAGDAGSGKTTFCTQFLFKGAELGQSGLFFLTFGGPPECLFELFSAYSFVDRKYFGNMVKVVSLEEEIERARGAESIAEAIESAIKEFCPRRIVIDEISFLEDALKGEYKKFIYKLSKQIKEHKAVAVITGEAPPGLPYPQEIAQIAEGIILLSNVEVNLVRLRSIEILKIAGTSHTLGKHAVDISAKGLTVYPGLHL
jgi:circadian clock protein KaiC